MPRTEEQYAHMREERKSQILEVAIRLFSEEGYDRTSISRLASEAGISKGLIYNYFESKEAILQFIISHSLEGISEFIDPDHDGILTDDEMGYLIDSVFDMLKVNSGFWKLLIGLILQPAVISTSYDEMNKVFAPMGDLFKTYFAEKGVKDPDAMVQLVLATLDGVAMHYVLDLDGFPLEQIKDQLKNQYINLNK